MIKHSLWLLSLVSLPAFAHITVQPKEAPAGSYAKLSFSVPHGCGGSPTTAVRISIPAGVTSVKPKVHPGWTIELKKDSVSWTGGRLPDEYMDEFEMSVKLPATPNAALAFPVTQECEKGVNHWQEKEETHGKGHGEGGMPAPVVKLTAAKG